MGATPPSDSLRLQENSENPYIASLPGLRGIREGGHYELDKHYKVEPSMTEGHLMEIL